MATPELNFREAEIPAIVRTGGGGAAPIEWEVALAPLKGANMKNEKGEWKSVLVWDYEKETAAQSRISSLHKRLNQETPEDNWLIAKRVVPGSDPVRHGVYIQYQGTFTPEQVEANARKRADASQKRQATREAGKAAKAALDGAEAAPAVAEAATPAQRVTAAKAVKAAAAK
jgi:hypothetical protein